MLQLYRAALHVRRQDADLRNGPFGWLPADRGTLAFARGEQFMSFTNFSDRPVPLPANELVILASEDVSDGMLPPDATAWLRRATTPAPDATRRVPPEE
jgi:alpha-glucosidase